MNGRQIWQMIHFTWRAPDGGALLCEAFIRGIARFSRREGKCLFGESWRPAVLYPKR
jgi:hypothetical protein